MSNAKFLAKLGEGSRLEAGPTIGLDDSGEPQHEGPLLRDLGDGGGLLIGDLKAEHEL